MTWFNFTKVKPVFTIPSFVDLQVLRYLSSFDLLCPDNLQLLRAVHEVIRIGLRDKLSFIRLLHEILVSLLVGEIDCVFL